MFLNTVYAQTANKNAEQATVFLDFAKNFGWWVIAIFLCLASFVIASVVKKIILGRIIARASSDIPQEVQILLGRSIYAAVVVIIWVIALNIVGINLSLALGAISMGLGFAFKDLLANLIAGMVILTQKKFKIGDMVKIQDRIGRITEIETRTTEIKDFDGTLHIIPNSDMLTSVVQNYTAHSFRRISIPVGVHYDTPLDLAMQVCLDAVKKNPNIVPSPAPNVLLTEFADSAIMLDVRFWVESMGGQQSWLRTKTEIIQQIKKDFDEAGITIPFPIRTLALDTYDKNIKTALHLPGDPHQAVNKPSPTTTVSMAQPPKINEESPKN